MALHATPFDYSPRYAQTSLLSFLTKTWRFAKAGWVQVTPIPLRLLSH